MNDRGGGGDSSVNNQVPIAVIRVDKSIRTWEPGCLEKSKKGLALIVKIHAQSGFYFYSPVSWEIGLRHIKN